MNIDSDVIYAHVSGCGTYSTVAALIEVHAIVSNEGPM